jgi:hypothetical protein
MNRVKYTQWIDSYVEGELDNDGRKKFESELSVNRDLALEYHLEQDLSKSLKEDDLIDFRAKCIEAQQDMNLSEKKLVKIVQITRKYWYAAASILLIGLIVSGLFVFYPGGYSAQKIFKMYYKSDEAMQLRSGNVDMAEALKLFGKNDFKGAEGLFDEILADQPNNFAVMYYSGISNIEIKNYPIAIKRFDMIINDGDNLYIENSEWYLGLTYLAAGDIDQANRIFNIIASKPDHYYYFEVKSILEKIGKSEKNKKFLNNLLFLILPF